MKFLGRKLDSRLAEQRCGFARAHRKLLHPNLSEKAVCAQTAHRKRRLGP